MSSRQPLIGLVAQYNSENPHRYFIHRAYVQAIADAGGVPLIVPPQQAEQLGAILSSVQGVVLTGGVDVDPIRYGEQPKEGCGEISPLRDELDLAVTAFALEHDLPLLAICRGIQVLNVSLGGSLIQDILAEVNGALKHRQQAPGWYGTHDVDVQPSTLLSGILGSGGLRVNSFHHQAIRQVGQGLRISATAPDGIVEAVESTRHRFVLGVQWHPELMAERCLAAQAIFRHFVQAAAVQ